MSYNIIVGQSGGPSAVINSSLSGVYETAKLNGASKVYGMRYGIKGLLEEYLIDLDTYILNSQDIEILKRTPSSFLGSCRYKLPDVELGNEIFEKIFTILNKNNIKMFFYIGGNDSMDTICKLSDYAKLVDSDIKFVGVPKTIDNDLAITDHTPGYGSAAKYIATSIKELIRDALVYDIKSVTVVEIMGRNAGWLTATAALAKGEDCEGPDFIYLPEVVFDIDEFLEKIAKAQETKKSLLIAVSEGIKTKDGKYVCELYSENMGVDAFGHKKLTGVGNVLANLITNKLHSKARAVELNTLQRCASHFSSLTDVEEAYRAGKLGVKYALEGKTGIMVGFVRKSNYPYLLDCDAFDIHKIANEEKEIPLEYISDSKDYVNEKFIEYVKPLIKGELIPIVYNGLPRHLVIK